MPLWSNSAVNTSAPKFQITNTSNATGVGVYGNTSISQFTPGKSLGTFLANTSQVGSNHKITHAGWVVVSSGTGPVANITLGVAGTGYSNTDTVKVTPATGANLATASITTNGSGVIQTVVLKTGGSAFVGGETVSVANSTGGVSAGSGATFTFTVGGRAGRKTYETLVASGSFGGTATLP